MSRGYLLDSGVAQLVAMQDATTLGRLDVSAPVQLPGIVLGELYAGAYWYAYRHQSTKYLDVYDDLRRRFSDALLDCDQFTVHFYGAIYAELRAKGQLIQSNDIWIAALARQHGLTLVTVDGDFGRIAGFDFEQW